MRVLLLAVTSAALCLAGTMQAQPAPGGPAEDASAGATAEAAEAARLKAEADARWERLQAETAAFQEANREARERYERGVREAEAAREQYEADMARHRADLERGRIEQEAYQQRMREYEADLASGRYSDSGGETGPTGNTRGESAVADTSSGDVERPTRRTASVSTESCEQQQERNRRRGRAIGSLIGGVASLIGGGRAADVGKEGGLAFVPAAEMLGEAIAGLLDCEEQALAAAATEEAASGGMGATARWTSTSRPGVSGMSTVTAIEDEGQCITVTDIIIVDGEETRAPKRLCRRPPSNRYVRV